MHLATTFPNTHILYAFLSKHNTFIFLQNNSDSYYNFLGYFHSHQPGSFRPEKSSIPRRRHHHQCQFDRAVLDSCNIFSMILIHLRKTILKIGRKVLHDSNEYTYTYAMRGEVMLCYIVSVDRVAVADVVYIKTLES